MKRTVIILSLIFALAIALSVSIPTLAAPAPATGSTTVTGVVKGKIELTAPTGGVSLSDMVPGTPGVGSNTGKVYSNNAWSLTAQDTTNGGFMKPTSGDALVTPCQIRFGTSGGYTNAATGVTTTGTTKTGASGYTFTLGVSQTVTYDDLVGTYTIPIALTATTTD